MALIDEIAKLSDKASKLANDIQTEEATKNAFVMPLLQALGYDVFDPEAVVPEFVADVGIKRGEKVDYAIRINGSIAILLECKSVGSDLSKQHASQLYRYFSVTEARFGVLTNGIEYWFFSDLEEKNKMDVRPFFIFNLLSYRSAHVAELEKFSAGNFDLEGILGAASTLKYTSLMMGEIRREIENPSEELVRLLTRRVYQGTLTSSVRDRFTRIVANSLRDVVRDQVNQRLEGALRETQEPEVRDEQQPVIEGEEITTTEEELEAFRIIRAIARQVVDPKRVAIRDAKSYCAILLDDNNRRPIARLHFNGGKKRVGVFTNRIEERIDISSIDEVYNLSDRFLMTISEYTKMPDLHTPSASPSSEARQSESA